MSSHAEFFAQNGYVLIRGGIPPALVQDLRRGFDPILAMRERGETEARTRHQTILEPRCYHSSFKDFLNLESINTAAEEVIGTRELTFAGLAVLLGTNGPTEPCPWHRDHSESDPETQAILRDPTVFLQLNCAVYDDPALWVVPGSHKRASTPAELACLQSQPKRGPDGNYIMPANLGTRDLMASMPGAQHVHLNAGDCLLYNAIILHAAEYNPAWKRATLHGGWRRSAAVDQLKILRWGATHNPWLMHPEYMGDLGRYLGPQLNRYQAMVRKYEPAFAAKADAEYAQGAAVTAGPVAARAY